MTHILFGLETALATPQCWCVELTSISDNDPSVMFSRDENGEWRRTGTEEALLLRGLIELIERDFGLHYKLCRCYLKNEAVTFSLEGKSVKVSREVGDFGPPQNHGSTVSWKELAEALGILKSKRRHKAKQAYHLTKVINATISQDVGEHIRLLDAACGKSYVGFTLAHALGEIGNHCTVHGIESNATLVSKCQNIAAKLGWEHCTFEHADINNYQCHEDEFDALVALHACDTLTDNAIRIGIEAKIPYLFLVPCCQREMRAMLDHHPLDWISRYGLLEEDLADILTDGFRCMVLEAAGYAVKVLHFVASEHTPKNLLIVANYKGKPNGGVICKAQSFLRQFRVNPSAAALLDLAREHRPT